MLHLQVRQEEEHMKKMFGEDYIDIWNILFDTLEKDKFRLPRTSRGHKMAESRGIEWFQRKLI